MVEGPVCSSMSEAMLGGDDQGREKFLALERDRKKKQDRRFLTRKLLEDLEAILPSDGTSMRRTLHRILEDCIEHVKSARSSSVDRNGSSRMAPELWKEGLLSSKNLGVGTLNAQFCFTECNGSMAGFLGKDASSLVGSDLFSLLQPQDGIQMMQRLNRQKASGCAVQETVRLVSGGLVNVLVTKSGTQPASFCVVVSSEVAQSNATPLDSCGQKRPRSEAMDIYDLESAVSSAFKKIHPTPLAATPEIQEAEMPKPDVPYHPYLHGLRGLASNTPPTFPLFKTSPVTAAQFMSKSSIPTFAPDLAQLPANSPLAQYVQALSASQASAASPSTSFSLLSTEAPNSLSSSNLPRLGVLGLALPFRQEAQQSSTPASTAAALKPPLPGMKAKEGSPTPVPAATSPPETAATGASLSYKQQLKLQEQVERQYKQLNDLTKQLSTMKKLLSKHIPTLNPETAGPPTPHSPASAEPDESSKAQGEAKESKPERKGQRAPRKMPSTRNATIRWTREEHLSFLKGLERLGTGQWSSISKYYVPTRTPAQVASHHQKFAIRSNIPAEWRQKPSILDITTEPVQKLVATSVSES